MHADAIIESLTAFLDIKEFSGNSLDISMLWKDENDVAVDFSGFTGRLEIKSTLLNDAVSLLVLTENDGILLGDGLGLTNIIISLTPGQTQSLGPGKFFYDLILVSPLFNINTYLSGRLILNQSVTTVDSTSPLF